MQTEVVDAHDGWAGDGALCGRLAAIALVPCGAAARMRIGLEGAGGSVYRIVETASLVEAVHLCEALHELGFVWCVQRQVLGARRALHGAYRPTQCLTLAIAPVSAAALAAGAASARPR